MSRKLAVAVTPILADQSVAGGQFKEVFLHGRERRSLSFNVANPHDDSIPTVVVDSNGVAKKVKRGSYDCRKCGLPKKGHKCLGFTPITPPPTFRPESLKMNQKPKEESKEIEEQLNPSGRKIRKTVLLSRKQSLKKLDSSQNVNEKQGKALKRKRTTPRPTEMQPHQIAKLRRNLKISFVQHEPFAALPCTPPIPPPLPLKKTARRTGWSDDVASDANRAVDLLRFVAVKSPKIHGGKKKVWKRTKAKNLSKNLLKKSKSKKFETLNQCSNDDFTQSNDTSTNDNSWNNNSFEKRKKVLQTPPPPLPLSLQLDNKPQLSTPINYVEDIIQMVTPTVLPLDDEDNAIGTKRFFERLIQSPLKSSPFRSPLRRRVRKEEDSFCFGASPIDLFGD